MNEKLRKIAEKTAKIIENRLPESEVKAVEVAKNNVSEPQLGIAVCTKKHENTVSGPIFYVKDLLEMGEKAEIWANYIIAEYRLLMDTENEIVAKSIDYEYLKPYFTLNLVSQKFNQELLKTVPYKPFLDLAIIVAAIVSDGDLFNRIVVTNDILACWKVSFEDIYEQARNNFEVSNQGKVVLMNDILDEFLRGRDQINIPMYVFTNPRYYWGASCILDEKSIKKLAEFLDSDLIILPSSVHEVIIIPVKQQHILDREELSDMIQYINLKKVSEDEWLSDHAYIYRKNGGFGSY